MFDWLLRFVGLCSLLLQLEGSRGLMKSQVECKKSKNDTQVTPSPSGFIYCKISSFHWGFAWGLHCNCLWIVRAVEDCFYSILLPYALAGKLTVAQWDVVWMSCDSVQVFRMQAKFDFIVNPCSANKFLSLKSKRDIHELLPALAERLVCLASHSAVREQSWKCDCPATIGQTFSFPHHIPFFLAQYL